MRKSLYYIGFCIVVLNAGAIITQLIFNDEFSWSLIDGNFGFLMFGILEMLYYRLLIYYDELEMNTYYLILGIESECGADGSRKIQEKARAFKFLANLDPEKFYKEHIAKNKEDKCQP